jgi:hypothetical protein
MTNKPARINAVNLNFIAALERWSNSKPSTLQTQTSNVKMQITTVFAVADLVPVAA